MYITIFFVGEKILITKCQIHCYHHYMRDELMIKTLKHNFNNMQMM